MGTTLIECLTCHHRTFLRPEEMREKSLAKLSRRLRCSKCNGGAVRVEDAAPPRENDLFFAVEVWASDDRRVDQVLARSVNLAVARAAFREAVTQRPGRIVRLRDRARIIDESKP